MQRCTRDESKAGLQSPKSRAAQLSFFIAGFGKANRLSQTKDTVAWPHLFRVVAKYSRGPLPLPARSAGGDFFADGGQDRGRSGTAAGYASDPEYRTSLIAKQEATARRAARFAERQKLATINDAIACAPDEEVTAAQALAIDPHGPYAAAIVTCIDRPMRAARGQCVNRPGCK
jgi:hypothetical protein